jgi:hypothetical protein
MNIPDLCAACTQAIMAGQNITLSLPPGCSWPNGFPRGELLSVGATGCKNVSHDPVRVLAWVQRATKAMQSIHDGFQAGPGTSVGVEVAGKG